MNLLRIFTPFLVETYPCPVFRFFATLILQKSMAKFMGITIISVSNDLLENRAKLSFLLS